MDLRLRLCVWEFCVFSFGSFFFFFFSALINSNRYSLCMWLEDKVIYSHFIQKKIKIKMCLTILFTHLKIIYYSVFSFNKNKLYLIYHILQTWWEVTIIKTENREHYSNYQLNQTVIPRSRKTDLTLIFIWHKCAYSDRSLMTILVNLGSEKQITKLNGIPRSPWWLKNFSLYS